MNWLRFYADSLLTQYERKSKDVKKMITQSEFTYSKLTIETLEKGVKYVQS